MKNKRELLYPFLIIIPIVVGLLSGYVVGHIKVYFWIQILLLLPFSFLAGFLNYLLIEYISKNEDEYSYFLGDYPLTKEQYYKLYKMWRDSCMARGQAFLPYTLKERKEKKNRLKTLRRLR